MQETPKAEEQKQMSLIQSHNKVETIEPRYFQTCKSLEQGFTKKVIK